MTQQQTGTGEERQETSRGDSQTVIFLHVPKTGGMTLTSILARQYPREAVARVMVQEPETVTRFFALDDEARAGIRCVNGHIPFGFHEHLPGRAVYIALLRNPVKRFISEYRHLLQAPDDWAAWQVPAAALASIDAYLDHTVASNMANTQTRLFSGHLALDQRPPLDPLPPGALEQAKTNLAQSFSVAGLTERFDESVLLMKQAAGWRGKVHHMRRNVRSQGPELDPVSGETMARIAAATSLDAELVEFASGRLEEQINSQGPEFASQLRELRRMNGALDAFRRTTQKPAIKRIRSLPGLGHLWRLASRSLRRIT